MKFDRQGLLKAVLLQFQLDRKGVHGPGHWARVRYHALLIGQATQADLLVVELFAFLHDTQRLNEYTDPDHGKRAADYAQRLNGRFFSLEPSRMAKLRYAMSHHSEGALDQDPTVQTCWDADRLDLGRVGTKPSAKYLSAQAAQHIESAYRWSQQNSNHRDEDFGL